MIERTCENCNQVYQTFPSIRLRFCSSKCAGEFKRTGHFVPCAQCGNEFWQYPSTNKKYCSHSCATTARNLSDANPSYHRDVTGENNPMHSTKRALFPERNMSGERNGMFGRKGELCPSWNGGRKIRKDGYIFVTPPENHPHPIRHSRDGGPGYILEHRHVMEQHIGRFLDPKEVVHHIDGNKSNNSIDNLALLPNQAAHATLHMEERWINHDTMTKKLEYVRYLSTAKWNQKRQECLTRAGYKCERCGKPKKRLAIHHKTYDNIFNEPLDDLEVLCTSCHSVHTNSR